MKKVYVFAGFILALFVVFACTIPSSIEIKGSPKIKFAANMDFTERFSEIIGGAFGSGDGDFRIRDCINAPNYKTFLISMVLINERFDFELEKDANGIPEEIVIDGINYGVISVPGDIEFKLANDVPLIKADNATEPMKMDFSSLNEYLLGFRFDEDAVKAKLYISGPEIVGNIYIDLFFGDEERNIRYIELGTSDIDPEITEYTGIGLPDGGQDIEIASLLNSKKEIEIKYDVYMPSSKSIKIDWLDEDVDIVVELVVWVPLELVAGDDGAEFSFPGSFMDGVGEFVKSIADVADSLSLVIEMNQNPFAEGTLFVRSGDIEIENALSDTSLNFAISEDDMKRIIDADPFEPTFSIEFGRGKHLKIPKELTITTISLEAKLHYNIDFKGEEE